MIATVDAYGYCPRHGLPARDGCAHCAQDRPAIDPARRLNVGCGDWPLLYFTNLDEDPAAYADLYTHVPPLPFADGALDEVYAGHFLEHLSPAEARGFLVECWRCLVPGGRLGLVVPDTRAVMTRWLMGDATVVEYPVGVRHPVADLDAVCRIFLYSTVQSSPHRWSYDLGTLRRALEAAGFVIEREIDRFHDPRLGTGQWYQAGWDAVKP